MKEEVKEKVLNVKQKKQRIPNFKKIWYSITKFEKYPEMAAEGVGRAFSYLAFLGLLVAIVLSICVTFQIRDIIKQSSEYFDKNVTTVNYKDGNLEAEIVGENKIVTDIGTLIVDTSISSEEESKYEKEISSSKIGIIWLKDKVIFKTNGRESSYVYKDILNELQITEFTKDDILKLFNERLNTPSMYTFYFVSETVVLFINFFLTTLADILVLTIFGILTSLITKIQLRYRAVFNMSVYAITISSILQTIYRVVQLYIDFNIKYFDLMYTAISYICLAAAIFMIRSDVVKQQIELIKLRQEKEEKEKEEKQEEERKEEEEEGKNQEENQEKNEENKNQEENNQEENNQDEKQVEGNDIEGESQGSNA